jgi:hypothetical protein
LTLTAEERRMVRALMIGEEEARAIREAVAKARASPIPWEKLKAGVAKRQNVDVIKLEDRPPDHVRAQSICVDVPVGFRFCVSYEQQPAGLLAHFSVSVDAREKLPHEAAVHALLQIVDFDLRAADSTWVEEFLVNGEPGGLAINIVFLEEEL